MIEDDERPTIGLTGEYEADWMARGRKEAEYRQALQDYMQEEHGYTDDETEILRKNSVFSGLTMLPEEWDEIWSYEAEPAEAMMDYLGEETVIATIEDDFETKHRNRLEQRMAYRPHMEQQYEELYGDDDD